MDLRPRPQPLARIARLTYLAVATLIAAAPARAATELAQGEKRIALVVGNAAYPEAPLRNPVNDARAMAQALRGRGFEVILRENATKAQMESATADFGEKLTEGATGLFFYAGHGMQVNGRNYLIPVDAKITSEQRVRLETLDVEAVLDQMAAARARVSMVILDACRNNPFERRFRSVGGGLAQINAPEGTLIAYATSPGKVAADGEGANGLYTRELLRAVSAPGLKVEDVFKQVRVAVSRASNGAQIPWEASSLTGDFYFNAPAAAAAASPASAAPAPVQGDRELAFWDAIKASNDPADFRDYLQRYPDGNFASLAKRRLAALDAAARPAPAPRPVPAPQAVPATRPVPAPAPAPTPAPAPPPVAALPAAPAVAPTPRKATFKLAFPAGSLARNPVEAQLDVDGGNVEFWGSGSGATCTGRGKVDAAGTIGSFDARCIGNAAGQNTQGWTALDGRVAEENGVPVLRLNWRNAAQSRGELRVEAR